MTINASLGVTQDIQDFFSLEDFSTRRNPKELLDWSLSQFEKIGEVKDKKPFFQRKGLAKVLIEEIYPMAIFCNEYYNGKDVLIKPNIGNENYDAIVYDNSSAEKVIEKLEITQAIEGYQDSLRREILAQNKPVPFTGDIEVKIEGERRVIEAKLSGGSVFPLIHKIVSLSKLAIEKKMAKKYEEETVLLVVLNSLPIIPTSFIGELIQSELEILKCKEICIFSKIFLINAREEIEAKHFCVFNK